MNLDVKKIRMLMVTDGLTVTALAKKAHVSCAALNLWLNHGKRPRIDKIGGLAKALGVPITSIITEE
ncbi:helix-turn-helix domain-containing protein [Selenomonas ruminantium]|uniref:helix-turn-helix domain-containing protein n=1 Tax=Selenomonas ruminantium TaxID=971 RepID=UPI0026EF5966|nr:helix-turn-helix transcriptional regulator [Selenomonas ruminantium]